MATLVLGALGTLVGGPVGGAIGATLGRGLDTMIIGSPRRDGPRLKELAVSTSSYGQPIPALFGTVRVPGTVIWATDFKEQRETSGGGKGKPKTTSYSYSVSLAVALSSRPIERIGRVWADGNLLRGRAGDLKTGGMMRCHTGYADQPPDPLMAAALGPQCPAHRGSAYAVLEDLALEDFGNRIPALSFEVFASPASRIVSEVAALRNMNSDNSDFPELTGFIHEGGTLSDLLALVDRLKPLAAVGEADALSLDGVGKPVGEVPLLPSPAAWDEGEFGQESGQALARRRPGENTLSALRFYDPERDYQPGLQRAEGTPPNGAERLLEFPGVLSATDARSLLGRAVAGDRSGKKTLAWRMSELDPTIGPGTIVRAPGHAGLWQVTSWEWRERGIELELERYFEASSESGVADGGSAWSPADRDAVATSLRVFELPWDGSGSSGSVQRFAAIGAPAGRWAGAALYRQSGGALIPIAESGPVRAVNGSTLAALGPSRGLRLETSATLRLQLENAEAELEPATTSDLARGANRILVGDEVIQFASAAHEGDGVWRLCGLLRGRGGTESAALTGHDPGTPATLLDDRLLALPENLPLADGDSLAAIGIADSEPVSAVPENVGRSRRPLFPVHPASQSDAEGRLLLSWTRRARGGWAWPDEVEQPLVEQVEAYEVGLGPPDDPTQLWRVSDPCMVLEAAEVSELASLFPGADLWVRQKGSFAVSPPIRLATLTQTA